ncbi:MAG: hypothetical protein II871_01740 [Clostridia bacterium]|nr:hypothetical protein [Clostridia bacterium]
MTETKVIRERDKSEISVEIEKWKEEFGVEITEETLAELSNGKGEDE